MIGFKFLNRMGRIRKSIKKPIIKKKNYPAITVLLLLTKTCFFLKKLITPKLNGQFFGEKSR